MFAAHSTIAEAVHARSNSRRSLERRITLTILAGMGTFQLALVAGAPWGAAAWGGQATGVLPDSLRVASAANVVVYLGLAATVTTTRLGLMVRRRLLTGASLIMVLGTVMNLATRSPVERLWAPVAAALAVLLWRSRP